MSDAGALQVMNLCVAAQLIEARDFLGAAYVAPWGLLNFAIRGTRMTRRARLQTLEVAYSMFRRLYDQLHDRNVPTPPERGSRGGVTYFANSDHLRRAMNLTLGIFFLVKEGRALDTSRAGTYYVELLWAGDRTFLRGHTQWNFLLGAEVIREMISDMNMVTGLRRSKPRCRATVAGAILQSSDEEEDTWEIDDTVEVGSERQEREEDAATFHAAEIDDVEDLDEPVEDANADLVSGPVEVPETLDAFSGDETIGVIDFPQLATSFLQTIEPASADLAFSAATSLRWPRSCRRTRTPRASRAVTVSIRG
jgi:hypothetical protein